MANNIVLSGFKQFQDKLKKLPQQVQKEVGEEVRDAGRQWERLAKQDAPKDMGRLSNEIRSVQKAVMTNEIVANIEYAHIMEWGSKRRVSVPPELSAYASTFRGQPKGTGAKKFIYAWCRRVGIPEERWYFVYRSIMQNGVKPKPFFFKQRKIVEPILLKRLKTIVNTEH